MNHHKATNGTTQASETSAWRRGNWLVGTAIMLALIGVFFQLREHWAHIAGYWPYLLFLACPVMHLFHGHGDHGQRGSGPGGR